jgi:hypothetical protein
MNSAEEISRRLCTFSNPYLGVAASPPHIKYPQRIENSAARSNLPVGRDPRPGSRGAQKCDIETARKPADGSVAVVDRKFNDRQARTPTGLIADVFKC